MMDAVPRIVLREVSKFYGEVLGVNRVSLAVEPGITSLVGPNGAGKTTLLNLMTGLLRPTEGEIEVLGIPVNQPERVFRHVGYCTQYDAFPKGLTGYDFICGFLRLHGRPETEVESLTRDALARVNMTDAAGKKIAAYSKGMRQRIKLAQAIAHQPRVLILDEPLNGLDPMARAEVIAIFQEVAADGCIVIVSSHILHEVDILSDRVIMMNHGYVVAEGGIHDVREEVEEHPMQILVRCDRPAVLAARIFELNHAVEVKLHPDGRGLLLRTKDAAGFYRLMNRIAVEENLTMEGIQPADDDVQSLYDYLIGNEGGRAS
ncbi:MAG TPA: ABC transporter ATP-binding protein [Acidobacteriota bacterium]|nr:ABC transporter ATP-binding protein [Acidobacteriota bacterium]HQF87017.1 ABC transporter ATP-binding protein [Acidobacteriota bacterium]HQG91578.1 ABC transporter ATP-binding protein [Acidobacteriota bacterium]HQK89164.1 ABC transporter ATP-binding protein [Acidobacteriota bacterium]